MKKSFTVILLLSLIFVMSSCSKDKRIERSLHKKGGEWNIDKYTTQNIAGGYVFSSEGENNVGTMTFSENGSVLWTQTVGGVTQTINGDWTNNENILFLQSDTVLYEFRIKDRKAKEMTLSYDVVLGVYGIITDKTRTILELTKK